MLWEYRAGLFWLVVSLQLLCSYITEAIASTPHATETSFGSQLQFQSDLQITHMYSGEGEEVKLFMPVWPTGNVEDWLRDVEKSMKATLRDNIDRSLRVYPEVCDYVFSTLVSLLCPISIWGILKFSIFCKILMCSLDPQQPRVEWVLSWPGQVVIAGCQVYWTAEVSEALERGDLTSHLYPQLQTQVCTWD